MFAEAHIRDILQDEIQKEIVGPHEIDETFPNNDSPKSRYISGVLYPIQTPILEEDVSNSSVQIRDPENNEDSEKISINVGTKPSSMGLTCNIPKNQKIIMAYVSYGRYIHPDSSELKKEEKESSPGKKIIENNDKEKWPDWKRIDHEFPPISIDPSKKSGRIELEPKIFFRYFINENPNRDYLSLNVFITNESTIEKKDYVNDLVCVFQPKIKLTSPDSSKIFLNISKSSPEKIKKTPPGERINLFLFRNFKHFATGKNCAVEWDLGETEEHTNWVQTTFTPHFLVPEIKPRKLSNEIEESLKMENLFKIKNFNEYSKILEPVFHGYENWIIELEQQKEKWKKSSTDYEKNFLSPSDVPQQCIDECRDALNRIKEGIRIIATDQNVGESFRFANEVMYHNILHSQWAKQNREKIALGATISEDGPNEKLYESPKWRLFQLAFLLLNVESLINPKSSNRSTADLLWFPTGGGKTEAYFGVIAFLLSFRRLKTHNVDEKKPTVEEELDRYGVSVIMRYTYRLLTLQQFQRAITLFCSCEYIRMKNSDNREKFGSEPFLVGLWVGHDSTPNSFSEAKKIIEQKRNNPNFFVEKTDPIQLLSCPWCGRELNAFNYEFEQPYDSLEKLKPKRIRIRCHKNCFFGKPGEPERVIPAVFVDEDIRNLRPSLLIATVDKFAQISWNWRYSTLFGNVSQYCKDHGYRPGNAPSTNTREHCNHSRKIKFRNGEEKEIPVIQVNRKLAPPELIIQDELHLIAGPLGTLTGLYETAIDILCTDVQNIKPKIIASTATTKKSDVQLKMIFNSTDTKIFPPQGFEFGDSYFAKVLPIGKDNPGKLHLGVCSTSVSGHNVNSRIAACLLRKIRHIRENKNQFHFNGKILKFTDNDLDPYYTLVNYYNTIKSLGAAVRMYEDTIPSYIGGINKTSESKFQRENNADVSPVNIISKEELTGRINASKIPKILQHVEAKLGDKEVLDALLCTNMLSVGVDVERLNVMVINGQPKSTSEYIQASGRIGRKFPGIVVTNYTYIRPRDLSYFENFIQFHSTYHKSVEPGTLTPFACRARDRGLTGMFIALARLNSKIVSEDPKLFQMNNHNVSNLIDEIKKKILERVSELDPDEIDGTKEDLKNIEKKWLTTISEFRNWSTEQTADLQYRRNPVTNETKPGVTYLLNSSRDIFNEHTFAIPESLREAESEIRLYYSKQYEVDE